LIAEEVIMHVCEKGEETYTIEGDILRYFDGFRWYRYRLPTKMEQPDKTTNDGTESTNENRILV
jgi:hypothetical protein